jgi:hypothetical protein
VGFNHFIFPWRHFAASAGLQRKSDAKSKSLRIRAFSADFRGYSGGAGGGGGRICRASATGQRDLSKL